MKTTKFTIRQQVVAVIQGIVLGNLIGWIFFGSWAFTIFTSGVGALIAYIQAKRNHRERLLRQYLTEFHEMIMLIDAEWRSDGIGKVLDRLIGEKKELFIKRAPLFYRRIRNALGKEMQIAQNQQWHEVFQLKVIKGIPIADLTIFAEQWRGASDNAKQQAIIIRRVEETLREKVSIAREIDTMIAQKRGEAMVMAGAPLFVIGMLLFMSPDYVAPLYETLSGHLIMGICLVVWLVCIRWMMSIVSIRV